jgi:bifunctional DNA-binding transcriptional regulator/antitoxin component of YhaV-PrlF toxin-antitoxin module
MEHDPSSPIVVRVRADGTIEVPSAVVQRMGFAPGDRVSVRLTDAGLRRQLLDRGVTESEVDEIAERQLEPRENVGRFLAAEGALKRTAAFQKRVKAWRARAGGR